MTYSLKTFAWQQAACAPTRKEFERFRMFRRANGMPFSCFPNSVPSLISYTKGNESLQFSLFLSFVYVCVIRFAPEIIASLNQASLVRSMG